MLVGSLKTGRNMVAMHYHPSSIFTRFPLKQETFDFGMSIGYVKQNSAFHYCFHNYPLDKPGAVA